MAYDFGAAPAATYDLCIRNGTIEHFNDTFDKRFFRQERFTGPTQLADRAGAFEAFHNSQHRYQATDGRAPDGPCRGLGAEAELGEERPHEVAAGALGHAVGRVGR